MAIIYSQGDILQTEAKAIVNPVNCVGTMGAGLALQIKRAYPYVFDGYRDACKRGEMQPGMVFSVTLPDDSAKVIINFPTKRHWKSKSKLEDIRAGLDALKAAVARLALPSIAVPHLGCGLGGLNWEEQVKPLVEQFASEVDIPVWIYGGEHR